MKPTRPINPHALNIIKSHRKKLTKQQYLTLRGQVLAGDADGAIKGLRRLLETKRKEDTPQ